MLKELINIEGSDDTPSIKLEGNGDPYTITISGVSMPENTLEFYVPLLEQIRLACANINDINLVFHLEYMNSMSNKQILKLIIELAKNHNKFSVTWKYNSGDELIKLKGEEMKSLLQNITFNVIQS